MIPLHSSLLSTIEAANRLLSQHRYGTPEHERGYALIQDVANSPQGAWAQWLLGAYHLQVIHRQGSQANALHWLQKAAAAGIAPAVERLADMALHGIAMPFAPARAMEWLHGLAEHGHAPSAWQCAYLSDIYGAAIEASDHRDRSAAATAPATLLLRACALGFGPAYYSLGLRFATGQGVPRDAVLGRALLLRASDAGFRDAREAAEEFAPDHVDAAESIRAALKINLSDAQPLLAAIGRAEAAFDGPIHPMLPKLESHLVAVGHPAFFVDAYGRGCVRDASVAGSVVAPVWSWTSGQPKVGIAAGFASREESAWLINKVAASMLRPQDIVRYNSANTDSEREQFSGYVGPLKMLDTDAVMRVLQRRIVDALGWGASEMEPSSIISYGRGDEYQPHCDFFTEAQIALNRQYSGDLGGQRIATFLLYLRAPERGGETEYPHAGLVVRGERGMAVVHYNIVDGKPDITSLHAGRPVLQGEKWLWRSTLREHPMYG